MPPVSLLWFATQAMRGNPLGNNASSPAVPGPVT